MANFLWGSAGQKMSPAQVAEQRKIAQALMAEASDTSPVGHWTAALNRGLQGYLGGRQAYQAREAENAGRAGLEAKRAGQANAATFGGADPVAAALSGGAGLGNYAVPAGGDVATSLFPASLIETESGGNWSALNNEGYGGRLQFGAARLADAANAGIIPAGIDGAAFSRLPPEQQMAVENWHFQDIENQARRMGLDQYVGQTVAGVPIDMNAIKGMAHLGGIGGAAKFLQSGGQYNPADSNGTSLAAYGRRHGGGATPAQGGGMSNIAAILADEWLPESERAVLQAQYESQLKQQDPMYQAQYEGQVLANQTARQPKQSEYQERQGVGEMMGLQGDALQRFVLTGDVPVDAEGFTLGEGDIRYDANGNVIAQGGPKTPTPDEYQRYVQEAQAAGQPVLDRIAYSQAIKGKGFSMTMPDGTVVQMGGAQGQGPEFNDTGAFKLDTVLGDIDAILASDLARVTGPIQGGGGNMVDELSWPQRILAGEEGLTTIERIGNLQNKTWMAARDMLKGGGSITDYESKKAEGAMARLSRVKSESDMRSALKDLRDAVTEGKRKLDAAKGGATPATSTPAETAAQPKRFRYNSQTGAFE